MPTIIVTHPKRLTQAQTLATQTHGTLTIDHHNYGASWNHDQALLLGIQQAEPGEWITILEDDAIPCDNWDTQLHSALNACPTRIASWYLGTNYPRRKQPVIQQLVNTDTHWIIHHELRHAVAYSIHQSIATQLHQTVTQLHGEADKRLSLAAQVTWQPIAYSNPSLVDHTDGEPLVTVRDDMRPRTQPRKAHRHGTRKHWTNQHTTLQ